MKKKLFLFALALFLIPMITFAEGKEVVIDFSKLYDDGSNMTMIQQEALIYLGVNEYLTMECIERENSVCRKEFYKKPDGKIVLYEYVYGDAPFFKTKMSLAENVTSADNFRVPIEFGDDDDDKPYNPPKARESHGFPAVGTLGPSNGPYYSFLRKYDSIYVMFGDLLPTPGDTSVMEIDFSKLGDDLFPNMTYAQSGVLEDLMDLGILVQEVDTTNFQVFIKTKDGKLIATMIFNPVSGSLSSVELNSELTYKDNFEYEFTEEDLEVLENKYNVDYPYSKAIIKFGSKPEPKPEPKPNVNPNTFNNIIYLMLILGITVFVGSRYVLKNNK